MQWGWALSQRVNNVGKGEGKKKKHSGKQEQYEWNNTGLSHGIFLSKILKFFLNLDLKYALEEYIRINKLKFYNKIAVKGILEPHGSRHKRAKMFSSEGRKLKGMPVKLFCRRKCKLFLVVWKGSIPIGALKLGAFSDKFNVKELLYNCYLIMEHIASCRYDVSSAWVILIGVKWLSVPEIGFLQSE